MKSKNVWGGSDTERWEFQKHEKPKQPEVVAEDVTEDTTSEKEYTEEEKFQVFLAASADLIEGDINLDEFKEVIDSFG